MRTAETRKNNWLLSIVLVISLLWSIGAAMIIRAQSDEECLVVYHCGDGLMSAQTGDGAAHNAWRLINKGESLVLESPGMTGTSSLTFDGWYTDKSFSSFLGDEGAAISVNSDMDLYAKWEEYGWQPRSEKEKQFGDFLYESESMAYRGEPDKITITDYLGKSANVTIPSTIDGGIVREIEVDRFSHPEVIESLSIPDTINTDSYMLSLLENLKEIGVVDTGAETPSVMSRNGVLYSADGTKLLLYPNEKEDEQFVVPEGVKAIDSNAFSETKNLLNVTIPSSLGTKEDYHTSYEVGELQPCINLKSITVANDNSLLCSEDGVVYTKDKSRLLICPSGKEGTLTLPAETEKLSLSRYCMNISKINVSDNSSFKEENGCLFDNEDRLLFCVKTITGTYSVPERTKEISWAAFANCNKITTIVVNEGVEQVEPNAFSECDKLKNLVLPSTLKTFYINAFPDTENLENIYIKATTAPELDQYFYTSEVFFLEYFPDNTAIHVYKDAKNYDGLNEEYGYYQWNDYKNQIVYDLDDIDLSKIGEDTTPDEPITKPEEPTTKPSDEPTTKPTEEMTKPTEESTTKPAEESTTKPSEDPTTPTAPPDEPATAANGIVKGSDGKWALYKDGKVDTSYTGIAKNQYGWWRVKDGYVDFNANGIYKNEYGWWKTTNGKVTFNETGIFKNEYGWWRVENSKVNFQANGIYKNEYGWWKTTNGKVTFKENGVFKNEYGWWKVEDSKVNFNFTGIAKNEYGTWYVKNGKVDFTKNGKVKYNGHTYTVVNGKVK